MASKDVRYPSRMSRAQLWPRYIITAHVPIQHLCYRILDFKRFSLEFIRTGPKWQDADLSHLCDRCPIGKRNTIKLR